MKKILLLLSSLMILLFSPAGLLSASIEEIRLQIYNEEDGVFREAGYDFHFNEFGPYMLEIVLAGHDDGAYYKKKDGLQITVKIGKRTYCRKALSFQIVSDRLYVPVFIDEPVICDKLTVIAEIRAIKGSRVEKVFDFTCGE